MTEFKTGDIVALKSGGPKMTVDDTAARNGDEVICKWFNGSEVSRHAFHTNMLRKVHDEDAGATSNAA